jgi:hypothetical protein
MELDPANRCTAIEEEEVILTCAASGKVCWKNGVNQSAA